MKTSIWLALFLVPIGCRVSRADAVPSSLMADHRSSDDMEVQIKGQFRGRLLVKKVAAPVTLNLEKLQNFPEDPSQRILADRLNIPQSEDFNMHREVKGHLDFRPWVLPIPEPPFLRMHPPENVRVSSWKFEVLNPQGQVIYRQQGQNKFPQKLAWNGKDSEMKFAVVGRLYSAQLTFMDSDGKTSVIQGPNIMMPALSHSSTGPQTIELALDRIFMPGNTEISPEGDMLLYKVGERMRELGLKMIHVRVTQKQNDLIVQREQALVDYFHQTLHVTDDQLQHDHSNGAKRGEIVVIYAKERRLPHAL